MNRQALATFLCVLMVLAPCLAALAAENAVSVGAAPDDYLPVSLGSGDAAQASLRLNGVSYRPSTEGTGVIRVTTGDLMAAAALEDDPALLANAGLSFEDVVLSQGRLRAAEGAADAQTASSVPPNLRDMTDALTTVSTALDTLLALQEDETDGNQARLMELKRLIGVTDAMQADIRAQTKYAERITDEDMAFQTAQSLEIYLQTRMPDMARDILLWLDEYVPLREKNSQGVSEEENTLHVLLEEIRDMRFANTNAVQERADQVNLPLWTGSAEALLKRAFLLTDDNGWALSFTVEAVIDSAAEMRSAYPKRIASQFDPWDGVKRLELVYSVSTAFGEEDEAAQGKTVSPAP